AQLVRAPALHAGCRGFESLLAHSPKTRDPRIGRWVRMFTDLEVIPLKGRLRSSALVLVAFAALIGSPVLAQSTKTGPRVMIPTLQSSDKELGVQAAEAIRSQLTKQTNLHDLVVVPKTDINNSLASSGYSTTEALAP